jgi:hypothetical protein
MFNDWKQAWQQAVENFQREMRDGASGAGPSVRAMEREIVSAQGALGRLDEQIQRTAREADAERESEEVCRRRETLARGAGDEETVRIAGEFAARHAQRAAVLARKLAVLQEERELIARDVGEMKRIIATAPAAAGGGTGRDSVASSSAESSSPGDEAQARDFSRLEREARERAASERLEELKRRMQG